MGDEKPNLTVRLTQKQHKKLAQMAEETGRSKTDIVRSCLYDELERHKASKA